MRTLPDVAMAGKMYLMVRHGQTQVSLMNTKDANKLE